ncbi:Uma2 family endonuclease [Microtetraspora malaysiensis]|uniref:Uma2 family endonuclease n=1 Tax=Microtetraspora malaysiensis TaxID=161358 RepID=UPI003D8C2A8E
MAKVLIEPTTHAESSTAPLDRLYQEDCRRHPHTKVEIINGRIVVREVPTREHARIVFRLLLQLIPFITERGWENLQDVNLFLHPQLDRYRPDLLIAKPTARMWNPENIWGSDTLLVVEVVSPSSGEDDHGHKPRNCALAGVPLYLVIDSFKGVARLMSDPGEKGYQHLVEVTLGKPLPLPEPWDVTLDTAALVEA